MARVASFGGSAALLDAGAGEDDEDEGVDDAAGIADGVGSSGGGAGGGGIEPPPHALEAIESAPTEATRASER